MAQASVSRLMGPATRPLNENKGLPKVLLRGTLGFGHLVKKNEPFAAPLRTAGAHGALSVGALEEQDRVVLKSAIHETFS